MPRDFRLFLDDILEAIGRIRFYVEGQDETAFLADRKTQDAVIRNLEIIGEAAGSLPDEVRDKMPEIDWRKFKGLRNILIHEYFGINSAIVWDIVRNKLGPLQTACTKLTASSGEADGQRA